MQEIKTNNGTVRIHPGKMTESARKEILTHAIQKLYGNHDCACLADEQRNLQPVCSDGLAC